MEKGLDEVGGLRSGQTGWMRWSVLGIAKNEHGIAKKPRAAWLALQPVRINGRHQAKVLVVTIGRDLPSAGRKMARKGRYCCQI